MFRAIRKKKNEIDAEAAKRFRSDNIGILKTDGPFWPDTQIQTSGGAACGTAGCLFYSHYTGSGVTSVTPPPRNHRYFKVLSRRFAAHGLPGRQRFQ